MPVHAARMHRPNGWQGALAVVCIALVAGCTIKLERPDPKPPIPIGAAPAREKRLAALLSIYFHALPGNPSPSPQLEPLAPLEAATILRADQTPRGEWWRRRAVAKLAASDIRNPEFRDAMIVLLRDDEGGPFGDPQMRLLMIDYVISIHPWATTPFLEALISNFLDTILHPTGSCFVSDVTTTVNCRWSGRTTATTTLEVNRPVGALAVDLDPQSWDECSDFFPATYVALQQGGMYPVDSNHNGLPAVAPPWKGSTWSEVLFEHFEMSWNFLGTFKLSEFKTFLDIDAVRGYGANTSYRVDYDLRRSIWHRIFTSGGPGGIDKDKGYLQATPSGSWSDVEAEKTIEFSSELLNPAACALLGAMGDAVAQQVCCTKRPPPP
jgi:hypothetical protein